MLKRSIELRGTAESGDNSIIKYNIIYIDIYRIYKILISAALSTLNIIER